MKFSFDKGFKQLRLGLSLFFVGLVQIYCASNLLQPSLTQEIVVGLAVVVLATGFTLAIVAEGRLILARFVDLFFNR